jgi:1,4-alpha-glucan branching enzyme
LALDQAIRECLLLQSSDWPFMLHGRQLAGFAAARVADHRARSERLLGVVLAPEIGDEQERMVRELCGTSGLLSELEGAELRDCYD